MRRRGSSWSVSGSSAEAGPAAGALRLRASLSRSSSRKVSYPSSAVPTAVVIPVKGGRRADRSQLRCPSLERNYHGYTGICAQGARASPERISASGGVGQVGGSVMVDADGVLGLNAGEVMNGRCLLLSGVSAARSRRLEIDPRPSFFLRLGLHAR